MRGSTTGRAMAVGGSPAGIDRSSMAPRLANPRSHSWFTARAGSAHEFWLDELLEANRRLCRVYVLKDDLKRLWDCAGAGPASRFWER